MRMMLDPSWCLEYQPKLDGFVVEWESPDRQLLSKRNHLFELANETDKPTYLGSFPVKKRDALLAQSRLVQRLLRFSYYNVLPLDDGRLFLTFGKRIGVMERGGEFSFISGLHRKFRVLRQGAAMAADRCVYFAEYFSNPDREAVNVYRYVPTETVVEVVYQFPAGSIRHVHGIYRDPIDDSLWCLTGDSEQECQIIRFSSDFDSPEIIGMGDETWRAVSCQFTEDAIYYAMDAEFRQNYLYRLDRQTGQRTQLAEMDGPVYYSARVGSDLFFGVAAELCPSQTGRAASVWHLDEQNVPTRVIAMQKDFLPLKYFQVGVFCFPGGPLAGSLKLAGAGLSGFDNRNAILYHHDRQG